MHKFILMDKQNRTELGELGEFGLIERLSKAVTTRQKSTLFGIGDDAAVIGKDGKSVTLISTDMLVEGIHFDMTYVPLKHLGYKLVAVNVSDIAAMNGIPTQITVSIALSNRFSVEAIEELYAGIHAACKNFNVDLVGGDTTSSTSGLIISVSVLGKALKTDVAYRSGAKVGDVICVTGDLGGAYMGLQLLEREKQVFLDNPDAEPQFEDKDYLIQRQLKPEARMDFVYDLKEKGIVPTSMIDVSDGLASELMHISRASNVGIQLFDENLPIDEMTYNTALDFNIDPDTCALNGGEDYELLFTVPESDFEKLKNHSDLAAIGQVTKKEDGVNLVLKSGTQVPLKAQGWVHF